MLVVRDLPAGLKGILRCRCFRRAHDVRMPHRESENSRGEKSLCLFVLSSTIYHIYREGNLACSNFCMRCFWACLAVFSPRYERQVHFLRVIFGTAKENNNRPATFKSRKEEKCCKWISSAYKRKCILHHELKCCWV